MKKLTKLLAVLGIAGVMGTGVALGAGCGKKPSKPEQPPVHEHTYESAWVNTDKNGHYHNFSCGHEGHSELEAHTPDEDGVCTVCGYVNEEVEQPPVHEHTPSTEWVQTEEGHYHNYSCGHEGHTELEAHNFGDGNVCSICGYEKQVEVEVTHVESVALDNTEAEMEVNGTLKLTATVSPAEATDKSVSWTSSDETVATVSDGTVTALKRGVVTITATTTDGAKAASCEITVREFEWVETKADFTNPSVQGFSGSNKIPEDTKIGRFTVGKETYCENASAGLKIAYGDINTQNNDRALLFSLTGEGNQNKISFKAEGANSGNLHLYLVEGETKTPKGTWACAKGTVQEISIGYGADDTVLPAGDYIFGSTDGSVRLGALVIYERLEKSDPVSLSASDRTAKFLEGATFVSGNAVVELTYKNGKVEELASSKYTVDSSNVNMNVAGKYSVTVTLKEDTSIKATYEIEVYSVKSIRLETYDINSTIVSPVKTVYTIGKDTAVSVDNLTVIASCECPDVEGARDFILSTSAYTVTNDIVFDVASEYTVTVTSKANNTATAELKVNVVAAPAEIVDNVITLTVDKSSPVSATNFHSITDALIYLKANVENSVIKKINIANGTYEEKISVDIPNVELYGSALSEGTTLSHTVDNGVIITYNTLAGDIKPAGSGNYGTNGSAVFAVNQAATNFKAYNITFRHYYNTHARYLESKALTGDTQAVACYVAGNKAAFYNCKFSSYHDTLYADKGWQYYEKCFIEGRTDYIFGTTAIAYFDACNIFSIGAGTGEANGGYVTAIKPAPAGTYFVYNHCSFDGDENVATGSVALGRAWGADMMMVVMNSTMSAKISTAAHTAKGDKSQRYCTMSGNEPKDANMLEYNNTGAGAVSASVANTCTVITAARAEDYTIVKVFVDKGWNPGGIVEDVAISIYDADGETVLATINKVSGTKLTVAEVRTAMANVTAPDGKDFDTVTALDGTAYSFDAALVAGELNLKVVWKDHVEVTSVTYTFDVSQVPKDAVTGDTLINDIFYVTANAKKENTKISGAKYEEDNLTFSAHLSLTKGTVTNAANALKFTVPEGKTATVTVYAAEKSDKSVSLTVLDGSGKTVTVTNLTKNGVAVSAFATLSITEVEKYEFTLSAGTYNIGGTGGGAYIFGCIVVIE